MSGHQIRLTTDAVLADGEAVPSDGAGVVWSTAQGGATWATGVQGWDLVVAVAGSDAATTGQSLVDVTGLTASVLAASVYEFEAVLKVIASADTNGMAIGFHCTQAVQSLAAMVQGNTTNASVVSTCLLAQDSATSSAYNSTSSGVGLFTVKGEFVTHATLVGVFSVQHKKLTSGTSTVKVGSTLKIRKVG